MSDREYKIIVYMWEMCKAGLPGSLILDVGTLAREDKSILGLMGLWYENMERGDIEEQEAIILDLKRHIRDNNELPWI